MPTTTFKISMAGLFHDIGMKDVDRAIVDKPRHALSFDERKRLETHSAEAAKILSEIPSISGEVVQAVMQHHESNDGHGYPLNLTKNKIIPMARLISMADDFCELAIAGPNSPGLSGPEAVRKLCLVRANTLDLQFINALKAVVGLNEPILSPPSR